MSGTTKDAVSGTTKDAVSEPAIVRDIRQFVADADALEPNALPGRFEQLALDAHRYQYERVLPYQRLCDRHDASPDTVSSWRQCPPVPTTAFRRLALHTEEPREIFRSSGTTSQGSSTSTHYHPFPNLYRSILDESFAASCLPAANGIVPGASHDEARRPFLLLVPERSALPDSSLSFMAAHVAERLAGPGSATAIDSSGLNLRTAREWLDARAGDHRPGLLFATAFALLWLVETLEEAGTHYQLPSGTVILETGGFKGRTREITRDELLERVESRLGVSTQYVVREYGMCELTSQCYSRVLTGGDPDLFYPPPWMKVRLLDPATLTEASAGEPGLVTLFDLGNVGSALSVVTQDIGVRAGADGLQLRGRAEGAELRGCSLTVEEMLKNPL